MSGFYNRGKLEIWNGNTDLLTSTIGLILVKSPFAFTSTHNVLSSIVADEVAGTGYARKTLASKTLTQDDGNNRATFDAADVTFTGFDAGTTTGLVLYRNSGADATSPLICFIDGGFPYVGSGTDLVISWSAAGILGW